MTCDCKFQLGSVSSAATGVAVKEKRKGKKGRTGVGTINDVAYLQGHSRDNDTGDTRREKWRFGPQSGPPTPKARANV
ncbi:hypothetical protein J1N35_045380 [Gossypium stocksii]|uniref:Uncharacterized protein n=1 Tax=Gossypium stocksii TaxID=47602 RepID=A0A9D3UAW4_9ROSI|nr:hypothetical protein J1N35_045380 [Gossypium stocksii]